MYTAMMLIVMLGQQPQLVTDTRGPYQTEAECKARLVEMQEAAIRNFLPYGLQKLGVKCEETPTI